MSEEGEAKQRVTFSFLRTAERRTTQREPIADVHVEMRTTPDAAEPTWAGSGIDISTTGMALVLPPELAPGTRVYLSFRLPSGPSFYALPAMIVRQDRVGCGAVRFVDWSDVERRALADHLDEDDARRR